jgi:hypothetical protein
MIGQTRGGESKISSKITISAPSTSFAPLLAAWEARSSAQRRGKQALYVTSQLAVAQWIAGGEQKYPFLKVDITRTSGETLLNKIKTEKLAGKILFDVVYGATVPLLPALGVVKPYVSSQAQAYPQKFREAKDFWTGVSANYYVMGYNTKLVSKAEIPKTGKI